jgi:hypothetical protein
MKKNAGEGYVGSAFCDYVYVAQYIFCDILGV